MSKKNKSNFYLKDRNEQTRLQRILDDHGSDISDEQLVSMFYEDEDIDDKMTDFDDFDPDDFDPDGSEDYRKGFFDGKNKGIEDANECIDNNSRLHTEGDRSDYDTGFLLGYNTGLTATLNKLFASLYEKYEEYLDDEEYDKLNNGNIYVDGDDEDSNDEQIESDDDDDIDLDIIDDLCDEVEEMHEDINEIKSLLNKIMIIIKPSK